MTLEDKEFLKRLTEERQPTPVEMAASYKNPYRDHTDEQLYTDFNELRPDLDHDDIQATFDALEEMGFRFLAQLHKKFNKPNQL